MRRSKHSAIFPGGFTLMEMLIVLVILVVIAGAVWPLFRAAMDKAELLEAAKAVRTTLSQARLDAIDSGTPRQFRYQPGGTQYEVTIYTISADGLLSDMPVDEPPAETALRVDLPSGVRFSAGTTSLTDGVETPVEIVDEWAAPVLLYPTGRSDNVHLRLLGAEKMYVEVWLRGITGVAKVGPVLRLTEDEP